MDGATALSLAYDAGQMQVALFLQGCAAREDVLEGTSEGTCRIVQIRLARCEEPAVVS